MSKRLQVLLEEAELLEVQQVARARHMTVAEWVRQVLRAACQNEPRSNVDRKLAAIRSAAQHAFPTADIDQMLGEIEQGYIGS